MKKKKISKTNKTILSRIQQDLENLMLMVGNMGYGTNIQVNEFIISKGMGHPLYTIYKGDRIKHKCNVVPEVVEFLIDPQ